HASLLPRWRGASPIQASIAHADQITGITIMKMDEGLDTGPILSQKEIKIFEDDTGGTLEARLAEVGAELLVETIHSYLNGSISPQPQVEQNKTYAGLLKKRDGKLDFQRSADELAHIVKAYNPWPGAFCIVNGEMFKVHQAHSLNFPDAVPGKMVIMDHFPTIGTANGWLVLDEVQPAGKKPMSGKVFLHGSRHWDHFYDE
ncbi:MAG: methionyl-tRNA formyltransferase, partial [Anaerolineaceae bacterium]|nr:methionyl-tRNA formyltransferase [Anaerolineaceae bacterium]